MLLKALEMYGVSETVGKQHNPIIMAWAKEVGLQNVYTADEIPWCGLFIAVIAKRADKAIVKDPLWALNWAKYGSRVKVPMLGDVLTFKRNGGGHVGLYVGEDETCYHVLGGNQGNKVSIVRIEKQRLHSASRLYNVQPANVRVIRLSPKGAPVSVNEA